MQKKKQTYIGNDFDLLKGGAKDDSEKKQARELLEMMGHKP